MTETKQVPVELRPDLRWLAFKLRQAARGDVVVPCAEILMDAAATELEAIAAAPATEPRYDLLEAANRLCALSADLAHQGDEERAYAAADIAAEVRVHAEATEPSEVERLAVEIADEAAWGRIFCESKWHRFDGEYWYDTSYAKQDGDSVDAEVKYLGLRSLLEHHPNHPEWVRVKGEKP